MSKIPQHLGLIPDGNRRWAEREDVSTWKGHQQGFNTFIDFCEWSKETGVEVLTAYGFSTENWNRPEEEISYLMELFEKAFEKLAENTGKLENAQIRVVGDRSKLPEKLRETVQRVEDLTENREGLKLNIALSYGGRWDIKQDVSKIVKETR